jgi:hypothetical protein
VGAMGTEKEMKKMWLHPIICDRRNNGLCWTVCEDLRRDGATFCNYFGMSVDLQKNCMRQLSLLYKKGHI